MSKSNLKKKTLNFREGDWEELDKHYKPRGLQVSTIIRYLVSSHVDKLRLGEADMEELMEDVSI